MCVFCETTWYKINSSEESFAYDKSIAPYSIDWADRNLEVLPEFEEVLNKIGNISNADSQRIYAAHVTLKNGFELTHVLIRLDKNPPTSYWLNKSNWHYLDQVKDIKPSKYAYPFSIAKFIKSDPKTFIFIKSDASEDVLRFEVSAGVFMPGELTGQQFTLLEASKINHASVQINVIYEVADRGGPDFWSYTPPPKPFIIWGRF